MPCRLRAKKPTAGAAQRVAAGAGEQRVAAEAGAESAAGAVAAGAPRAAAAREAETPVIAAVRAAAMAGEKLPVERSGGPWDGDRAVVRRGYWAGRAADGPAGIRRARSWAPRCRAIVRRALGRAQGDHPTPIGPVLVTRSHQYRANSVGADAVPPQRPGHPPGMRNGDGDSIAATHYRRLLVRMRRRAVCPDMPAPSYGRGHSKPW